MEIKAPDGTTIYRGDGKETTDFTVNIPESGVYAVVVEARRARGTIHIQCGYLPCPAYGKYCGKENAYCFEKELMK